jgi:MFS family permease
MITLAACFTMALSASAGSTYNQGFIVMVPELNTTRYIAGIGLAVYSLGCGTASLMTASLSEEFGRMPMYIVSAWGFATTHLMIAL